MAATKSTCAIEVDGESMAIGHWSLARGLIADESDDGGYRKLRPRGEHVTIAVHYNDHETEEAHAVRIWIRMEKPR